MVPGPGVLRLVAAAGAVVRAAVDEHSVAGVLRVKQRHSEPLHHPAAVSVHLRGGVGLAEDVQNLPVVVLRLEQKQRRFDVGRQARGEHTVRLDSERRGVRHSTLADQTTLRGDAVLVHAGGQVHEVEQIPHAGRVVHEVLPPVVAHRVGRHGVVLAVRVVRDFGAVAAGVLHEEATVGQAPYLHVVVPGFPRCAGDNLGHAVQAHKDTQPARRTATNHYFSGGAHVVALKADVVVGVGGLRAWSMHRSEQAANGLVSVDSALEIDILSLQ